jgi:hypothetical protein
VGRVTRSHRGGGTVQVRYTKWGGGDHWSFDGRWLGMDSFGVWVQVPLGTHFAKPGTQITAERHHVILLPHDLPFTAAFYRPLPEDVGQQIATYVDISTVPMWTGDVVTIVDLDLDVIRSGNGDILVDDEDEFAEHQELLGYPAEIVALAEASCAARLAEVRGGLEPFERVAAAWLAR